MDISQYLELKPAPRAVFDHLDERRARPRFMLPTADGDWQAITWGAFAKSIRHAAMGMRALGLGAGERVALYAPNRPEWASAALGAQAAGAVVVPIYPGNNADQAGYVVTHSDARILFVDTPQLMRRVIQAWPELGGVHTIVLLDDALDPVALASELRAQTSRVPSHAELERRCLRWSRLLALGAAADQAEPGAFEATLHGIDLDAPGLMLYTSGTTGNPKGVPLTHRNVGTNGRDWLQCNHTLIDESSVDLLWLPMSHIFGFGELCLGNTLGFTTYWSDPFTVLEKLPVVRPNVFMSVPSYWEKLAIAAEREATPHAKRAKLAELTGGRLRFCLSGGAGLKREVKERLHQHGVFIIEGYGLTECSPTLTLNRPDDFDFGSVGKPLPSVELKLAADGEILARGPNVFAGYHKDPAATAACFTPDGWLQTGDVGRFNEAGFLEIIDRKKDILVTAAGKNVPPANVELRFKDDPLFEHVVVYGDARPYLVAGVWLSASEIERQSAASGTSAHAKPEVLRALVHDRIERINQRAANYERIKRFHIFDEPLSVDNGLLTASLKIRRKVIYQRFAPFFDALYADGSALEGVARASR